MVGGGWWVAPGWRLKGLAPQAKRSTHPTPPPLLPDAWEPGVSNPSMQKFWSAMESLALHTPPSWSEAADTSRPDTAAMQGNHAYRAALEGFQGAVAALKGTAPAPPAAAAAAAGGKSTGKRARAGSGDAGEEAAADADVDWAAELSAGEAMGKHVTVEQLKAYCRRQELTLGGTKAVLIERVRAHLAGEGAPAGGGGGKRARKGA